MKHLSVGNIFKHDRYGDIKVTEIVNTQEVMVKFLDSGYEYKVNKHLLLKGAVKDPLQVSVWGVGKFGVGCYSRKNHPKTYSIWQQMLSRCYGSHHCKHDYTDCRVSEEFLNFQRFAKWCDSQIGFGVVGFDLDKDLLMAGRKEYNEQVCVFIPKEINLFLRFPKNKGVCRGVARTKRGTFVARLRFNGDTTHLGTFRSKEEAFLAYKTAKECSAKLLANKWKDQIDPRVYEALMVWEINMNT